MKKNLKSLLVPLGFVAIVFILFEIVLVMPEWFGTIFTVLWTVALIVVPLFYTGLLKKIINLFK